MVCQPGIVGACQHPDELAGNDTCVAGGCIKLDLFAEALVAGFVTVGRKYNYGPSRQTMFTPQCACRPGAQRGNCRFYNVECLSIFPELPSPHDHLLWLVVPLERQTSDTIELCLHLTAVDTH